MTKRRSLLGFGLLAMVAVAGGAVVWLAPQGGVRGAKFNLIQEGMTLAEVEAILGPPNKPWHVLPERNYGAAWQGGSAGVHVIFDDNGKVSHRVNYVNDSLLDKVRRWLGL